MWRNSTSVIRLRQAAGLWLGAAILSFGLFNVHSRCSITEGGVLGMTLLLQHWFQIPPGISGFVLDGICYLLGFRLLGKSFLKKALFTSLGFSLFYSLFSSIGYLFPDLTAYPLAASVTGSIFVGVGVGIVVRHGSASGGDDAIALILSKAFRCRVAVIYFFTDFIVLALSLTYIPLRRIIFSMITVLCSSLIIDLVQRIPGGGKSAQRRA